MHRWSGGVAEVEVTPNELSQDPTSADWEKRRWKLGENWLKLLKESTDRDRLWYSRLCIICWLFNVERKEIRMRPYVYDLRWWHSIMFGFLFWGCFALPSMEWFASKYSNCAYGWKMFRICFRLLDLLSAHMCGPRTLPFPPAYCFLRARRRVRGA